MEPVMRDKAAVSKCRKIRPEVKPPQPGLKWAFEVAEQIKMLPKKQAIKQKRVTFFSKQRERADVLAFDDQVSQKTKYLRV